MTPKGATFDVQRSGRYCKADDRAIRTRLKQLRALKQGLYLRIFMLGLTPVYQLRFRLAPKLFQYKETMSTTVCKKLQLPC